MAARSMIEALIGGRSILPSRPIRAVGIDLGTTNCVVAEAIWDPASGKPPTAHCVEVEQPSLEGPYTDIVVPSVVAVMDDGSTVVGYGARILRGAVYEEFRPERNKNVFWECKNEIGQRRTYHMAPAGLRSPTGVTAEILRFLRDSAVYSPDLPAQEFVITVPASFQLSQRAETVAAAGMAGIDLRPGQLLDEPTAAFLSYLCCCPDPGILSRKPQVLLVFDFGGGTCDVAVMRVRLGTAGIEASPLSVSRYHRLGGCDIDAAIIHEVLIPQLLEQNAMSRNELTYEDKKKAIEPALLATAEALKIKMCMGVSQLRALGRDDDVSPGATDRKMPGAVVVSLPRDRIMTLKEPSLTLEEFERVLKPFLDTDLLYARETEYRMTNSIFAPVQDALDRCGLRASDVDLCMMAGGSSLIPQVRDALSAWMPRARVLSLDARAHMTAVAYGAAYTALAFAIRGNGIVQTACYDRISILTAQGEYELVPKGTVLPYPGADSRCTRDDLIVPSALCGQGGPLRVEIVAGEEPDRRTLGAGLWELPTGLQPKSRLRLDYRMDESQVLDVTLSTRRAGVVCTFSMVTENPLTCVVNPGETSEKIMALEEDLRIGKIPRTQLRDKLIELAKLCSELSQYEKAVDLLKRALRARNEPDAETLNLMGIYYGKMRDFVREERMFSEAARVSDWAGSLFNLALSQYNNDFIDPAEETIQLALGRTRSSPYLVLYSMIATRKGDKLTANRSLQEAMASFGPPESLDEWSLGWLITACRLADDAEMLTRAENARIRYRAMSCGSGDDGDAGAALGSLPELSEHRRG